MYFLLNDALFNLTAQDLADDQVGRRFAAIDFDFVQQLGKELFAEHPLVQRTHPERAIKLCALILFKAPQINAALFVSPRKGCKPRDVGVRFASMDIDVVASLVKHQSAEGLTTAIADREVWRRLAA